MSAHLHRGDCLAVLRDVASGSVDLTVTSPPYDDLRAYNCAELRWDFEGVARELWRVTAPGGVVVWIVNDATRRGSETGTSFRQALFFKDLGFNLHDTMIWAKTNPIPQAGPRYTSAFEFMFVLSKGKPRAFNAIRVPCKRAGEVRDRSPHRSVDGQIGTDRQRREAGRPVRETKPLPNVWTLATQGQGAAHPAQFPEHVVEPHILTWSNPGDVVLDPFLGSGTTGIVALSTGRRFIGIERDPTYFRLAQRRIAAAQASELQEAA